MHWCNTISLHRLSLPHSLNALRLGHMLKSTSRTEPSPLLHTHDAAPVKSKVVPQLTALQGIDYHSIVHTVYPSHHQEGHRCHTDCHTSIDTLCIVITAQVLLHLASLGGHIKKDSLWIIHLFRRIVKFNCTRPSTLFGSTSRGKSGVASALEKEDATASKGARPKEDAD